MKATLLGLVHTGHKALHQNHRQDRQNCNLQHHRTNTQPNNSKYLHLNRDIPAPFLLRYKKTTKQLPRSRQAGQQPTQCHDRGMNPNRNFQIPQPQRGHGHTPTPNRNRTELGTIKRGLEQTQKPWTNTTQECTKQKTGAISSRGKLPNSGNLQHVLCILCRIPGGNRQRRVKIGNPKRNAQHKM